jgi:hypothetical protein
VDVHPEHSSQRWFALKKFAISNIILVLFLQMAHAALFNHAGARIISCSVGCSFFGLFSFVHDA